MRGKQQNADSRSKKTKFHERIEKTQENKAEIKEDFSFKTSFEAPPKTR